MRKPYEPELFHTAPLSHDWEEESNEMTAASRSRWIDRSIQTSGPERPSLSARGALPRLSGGRQRMA